MSALSPHSSTGGASEMAGSDKTWVTIQQNTFTNWCNDRLKGTGAKIGDLVTELDDGVKLVLLLERLAKKKVSNK